MNPLTLILAAGLAAAVGFAAHRASLCSVRAVEEILTTRQAYMLAGFIKSALWVVAVTLFAAWAFADNFVPPSIWRLSVLAVTGGAIFGVGAVLNGGCAFSTLTRFGSGDAGMAMTLAGFVAGAAIYDFLAANGLAAPPVETTAFLTTPAAWRIPITLALVTWMTWEMVKLRRRTDGQSWRQRLLASRYRLSTAAVLMGISSGLLYVLIGVWPYTRLFSQTARHVATGAPTPPAILWLLFAALLGGIILSAWQGRRFSGQWRPRPRWIRYAIGGIVMGLGAAMIPGGNDVLILHAIPSLSPHAVPAFLAMLFGIAGSLAVMRAFGKQIPRIDCGGDLCTADADRLKP